jgi:hypothetical protein
MIKKFLIFKNKYFLLSFRYYLIFYCEMYCLNNKTKIYYNIIPIIIKTLNQIIFFHIIYYYAAI